MKTTVDQMLRELRGLAPFPQVALKVMSLSSDENTTSADLVDVIQSDVGISAQVLREANSAVEGVRVEVGTVREAGTRLGTQRLVRLVMKVCAHEAFKGISSTTPRTSRSLWEESVTTACAARFVARRKGVDEELAYTCGLMQNIGHIAMDRYLAEERDTILAHLSSMLGPTDDGLRILNVEQVILGMDHAELGARLAEQWNFPASLVDAIRNHHTPESSTIDAALCSVMKDAEALTWDILGETGVYAQAYGLSPENSKVAGDSEYAELIDALALEGIGPAAVDEATESDAA